MLLSSVGKRAAFLDLEGTFGRIASWIKNAAYLHSLELHLQIYPFRDGSDIDRLLLSDARNDVQFRHIQAEFRFNMLPDILQVCGSYSDFILLFCSRN